MIGEMTTDSQQTALYRHVGQRLKERRRTLNISQGRLAELMDVSYQQIQKYENGLSQLSVGRMLQLAKVLNISPDYLYEGAPGDMIGVAVESDVIERNRNRPLNILVVEDNPADAILFDRAIQNFKSQVNVFCLNDPELVMDYFVSHTTKYHQPAPDLLVLDLNLPKVTGLQLLKDIKNNSQTMAVPTLILTHSISRREMQEAYRLGAAGFIQKSMDLDSYKESIELMVQYWLKAVALPQ